MAAGSSSVEIATLAVLLTLTETADMLRRSPAGLRYMIHAKTAPPSAIIGGRRMFKREAVEKWINDQFEQAESA